MVQVCSWAGEAIRICKIEGAKMPYSNIVFVKLFLSLFEEDDRFLYQLNESQQLLYVKMLYLAGSTNNHIPKNIKFICNKINYHHEEACFISDIARIKSLFQRFKESREGFYYFNNFNELHNFIGKSKGNPKEFQRIAPEKSKSKRRVREELDTIPPSLDNVRLYCQERKNNVDAEAWYNHYTAKGWLIGKTKMVDWKAAVRTWEKNSQAPISKPKQHEVYHAPDPKDKFKFVPEVNKLLKDIAGKKGI